MLISDSHRFIFVHTRKVEDSSIRDTLEPFSLQKPNAIISKFKRGFFMLKEIITSLLSDNIVILWL